MSRIPTQAHNTDKLSHTHTHNVTGIFTDNATEKKKA